MYICPFVNRIETLSIFKICNNITFPNRNMRLSNHVKPTLKKKKKVITLFAKKTFFLTVKIFQSYFLLS